ncbi:hypothetical protein DYI42_14785 [Vannielia litorea]|nr:hypothetical protein [Vannielia litorea]
MKFGYDAPALAEKSSALFWDIFSAEEARNRTACTLCAALYGAGLLLIAYIFGENLIFVLRQSF